MLGIRARLTSRRSPSASLGRGELGSQASRRRYNETTLAPTDSDAKSNDTLVVYFNGWRFESFEDAKAALLSTILEKITKRRALTARGTLLARRLWRSINVMQLVKSGGEGCRSCEACHVDQWVAQSTVSRR